jgi:photosystem II stability/assembly factor-like uncharacterized protein
MTSVACHPDKPDILWAGSAGGGVWYSENGGMTWATRWPQDAASLNIGSLAIDPHNPDVLFCGTGEANLSADSYPGVGLYKTSDGGSHWDLVALTAQGIPSRIGAVAVNPFDSNHVVLGGIGHNPEAGLPGSNGGMWTSRNGGASWKRDDFISTDSYWCHCIVFDPKRKDILFATFTERGAKNGIWRSTDGGNNWTQLTQGLPSADLMERCTIAISPQNPDVLYALVASSVDTVLGVFRTGDGGSHWQEVGGDKFRLEKQMNYGSSIVIHPEDPDWVLCGGVDLHLSTNGGGQWTRTTHWDVKPGQANYAHADHHKLLMPSGAAGRVYDMNDGGMDVSDDGGRNWENRSNGLAVTMFYDIDVAQSDPNLYGGGAQDNGTIITTDGLADAYFPITGGDGGWMIIDPNDENHLFCSVYNAQIFRLRSSLKEVSPPDPDAKKLWMVYLDLDPRNARTVFVGARRVWRSKDDGDSWSDVSGILDGSAITAVDVCRGDSNRIMVGTENGGLFRSVDGGDTWSGNIASAALPGFQINRIESHPTDWRIAYVVVGNFGGRHVFRTGDGGSTWVCIDSGMLPDVPYHSVVVPAWNAMTIYIAGDAGVYASNDEGQSWVDVTANLPNVSIIDLVCHEKGRTLTAATYGRSLWRIQL